MLCLVPMLNGFCCLLPNTINNPRLFTIYRPVARPLQPTPTAPTRSAAMPTVYTAVDIMCPPFFARLHQYTNPPTPTNTITRADGSLFFLFSVSLFFGRCCSMIHADQNGGLPSKNGGLRPKMGHLIQTSPLTPARIPPPPPHPPPHFRPSSVVFSLRARSPKQI